MFEFLRHFFGFYTKEERFIEGFNTMVDVIRDGDLQVIRDVYYAAVDNIDFNEFDKGVIRAYDDWYANGVAKRIEL